MIDSVKHFLHKYNLGVRQFARMTNIHPTTVSSVFRQSPISWRLKYFIGLAKASNQSLDSVIHYFVHYHWHLIINNRAQIIQGVHIPNKKAFKIVKSVVQHECNHGWKPNTKNVEMVVRVYYRPYPDVINDINKAKKEFDEK